MCSSFSCCLWLSCRLFVGEPLWHPGPRLAVAGRRQDSAWAVGGQAAYSLCSVAILYQQPKRLLHVPHPCHCPKLWGLLCLPAATYAGMHGLLCSRYVCSEQKWILNTWTISLLTKFVLCVTEMADSAPQTCGPDEVNSGGTCQREQPVAGFMVQPCLLMLGQTPKQ